MKNNNETNKDNTRPVSQDNDSKQVKSQVTQENSKNLDLDKKKSLKMYQYTYDSQNQNDKNVKKRTVILYSKRVWWIFVSAIIFNLGIIAFMKKAETIPSGLSGVPTLLILAVPKLEPWFAVLYLAFNVPLFLGFGFKEKRSFVLLTLGFMIFQIATNAIITYGPVYNWISQILNISPGWQKDIVANGITYENDNQFPVFVNGVIGSALLGISIGIAWKNGGSTGGTDIIAYYFSTKKKKSISRISFIISCISSILFLVIYAFVKPHHETLKVEMWDTEPIIASYNPTGYKPIIGMREFTTLLYIIIHNILIEVIYPKYKKVTLEISTHNPEIVLDYFKSVNYWHAYTIYEAKSGYSGDKVYKIESTMLLLETNSIISDLKSIDQTLWISIKPVSKVIGTFNTNYVEQ